MKKLFRNLLVIIILSSAMINGQTNNLTILYFGDTHSNLAPLGPRNEDLSGTQGGIARAASVIGLYETSGANVLTLHAGDYSIGDFFYNKFFGVPELQILNSLGVDAMTVGNHEFDLGPATLYSALNTAFGSPSTGFPLLSANADLTGFPLLTEYIKPYTIKTFGELKVGIFGLTTHAANIESNPSPVVLDEDFLTVAGATVQALLAEGCNFIICLSHYGYLADQYIASYIPGINIIIGGHDHFNISPVNVNGTWIVQAESHYKYIGKVEFAITGSNAVLTGNEMIKLDSNIPELPAVKATIDYLVSDIESVFGPVYTQQIARSVAFLEEYSGDATRPGNHSTAAGNFVADALKWKTGADFAIEASGSIAQPVYQGPLVAADFFRVVGYGFNTDNYLGFRLATFSITGMDLYAALETILSLIENEDYLPQFSGLKLKYIPNAPVGNRIESVTIGKNPLNPFATYTAASNEFVLMILDALDIEYSNAVIMEGYSEFQNLIAYTAFLGNKLTPVRDARVVAVKNSGNVKKEGDDIGTLLPMEYSLSQNYPNPFNPSTEIQFSLGSDSKIRLSVYNILGEEIVLLADGLRIAGTYRVTWNADNFPGGVYIYCLQSEEFSATKKMVLLK
jgi:5'-nucleotidase / UDP-sugar diphosphatase